MKQNFLVNLIASLLVGAFISGFFWVMVWLANFTGLNFYLLIFIASSLMVLYIANQN